MRITPSVEHGSNRGRQDEPSKFNGSIRKPWVILSIAVFAFACSIVFVDMLFPTGVRNGIRKAAIERGLGVFNDDNSLKSALKQLPRRLADNILYRPALPKLIIDIKFRHLSNLNAKRREALDIGYLVQGENDYVPASIRIGGRTVDVKLRLKGDMLDHVRTEKWSFRVHTKNDHQIFGLRRFSLQHPITRGFQYEILFQNMLRRLDVLAPKYFFVEVVVNGNSVGLMALEEHFSKELLERNRRRDGVIIRFDESLMWADRVARGKTAVFSQGPFDRHENASISVFQQSKVTASESLSQQYSIAAGLLRGFAEGHIKASSAFDTEMIGRFLAIADFWGAWHAIDWNNLRFYLNPLTIKLEPIGYDAHLKGRIDSGSINSPGYLVRRMLDDPAVLAEYRHVLNQLQKDIENGSLLSELNDLQTTALRELRTEFLFLQPVDLEPLRARIRELTRSEPAIVDPGPFGAHVIAQLIDDGERKLVELSNPLPYPVAIHSIEWRLPSGSSAPFQAVSRTDFPLILMPADIEGQRKSTFMEYTETPLEGDAWLEIITSVENQAEQLVARSHLGFLPLQENPLPEADITRMLAQNSFLSVSDDGDELLVKKGIWRVEQSIVVPRDQALRIPAGTTLRFEPDVGLVSYGPTFLQGTKAEPVVLEGSQANGNDRWAGTVVFEAPTRSTWSHVAIRDTAGVPWPRVELTGGSTFYRSDIDMSFVVFSGSRAEDALNIIHSKFNLLDVDFVRTVSDGFDSDFSTGSISGGSFQDIGIAGEADGLDFSGSEVTIDGVRFKNISDKAVSVGERSSVTARDIRVESCSIGAVSKDDSMLKLADSSISNATTAGLMSYIKKAEYGAASLVAANVIIANTKAPALAQHGSHLELNGKTIATQALDIDAMYQMKNNVDLSQ
jgi:hypothetical protein